jgi:hypothetical protein
LALEEACDHMAYLRPFLELFWERVHLEVGCDSADTIALLRAAYPRPAERELIHKIRKLHEKTIVIPLFSLADNNYDNRVIVYKVHTSLNLADALTKSMSVVALYECLLPTLFHEIESSETKIHNETSVQNGDKDENVDRRDAVRIRPQRNRRAPDRLTYPVQS